MAINTKEIMEIFFPYASAEMDGIRSQNKRFVHYTSADTAKSIIENECFWMRKASCMNDYREAKHGWDFMAKRLDGNQGKLDRYFQILNRIHPTAGDEVYRMLVKHQNHLMDDVYISSFSEHENQEDPLGRLSMWRAYGGTAGVALVLNHKAFLSESNALKAYTSPVFYGNEQQLDEKFCELITKLQSNSDRLTEISQSGLVSLAFDVLRFVIHATKHPGFKEEKEWRVIYCPEIDRSERLKKTIETIGGVPQPIYKIPLEDYPEENFIGATLPDLIERVIIGPTAYPSAIREAFVVLLHNKGVADAENKVITSDIPLRC